MAKNKILVVDGNHLMYRAYYKYGKYRTSKGVLSGVVYGIPYILGGLIREHNPDEVVVVYDGSRDAKRLELLPSYKQSKSKHNLSDFDREGLYKQRDAANNILLELGLNICLVEGREGDDIVWVLTKKLKLKNHVVMVSSDKDYKQLISKNVSLWDPKVKFRYTHKNLKKETGYSPEEWVDFLILDGDTSDNIKGMPGVGQVRAKYFIDQVGSIENYLTSDKDEITSFPRSRLEEVYLLNRQLIDIKLFVRKNLKGQEVRVIHKNIKKVKVEKIAMLSSKWEITQLIKPNYISIFEKLLKRSKSINIWKTKSSSVVYRESVKQL